MKIILLGSLLLFHGMAYGASDDDSYSNSNSSSPTDKQSGLSPLAAAMQSVKGYLADADYAGAVVQLKKIVVEYADHANAWNLLGFAERKSGNNDASRVAYEKALMLDPNHKSALEYQGELFISLKNYSAARLNLQKLSSLCPTGCSQLEALTAALVAEGEATQ